MNRIILEDLEQKVLALRSPLAKIRDLDGGASFGDVVARARPRPRGGVRGLRRGAGKERGGRRAEFEFRLRILDVRERQTDPPSYLGIVEGFPGVMAHATSTHQAEVELQAALADWLERLVGSEATRLELDVFPTVKVVRIQLAPRVN